MQRIISLFALVLLTMSAWADTVVTLDFSAQGYNDQQQIHELAIDGVTVTFDKGTNTNNPPTYYNTGTAIRLYPGNTMTVTGEQNIKKIDFTFGSGDKDNDILCDVGSYNKAGKQWTIGSSDPSTAVVFSVDGSSGHRRFMKLVVTMEDAEPVTELLAPVFHPDGGEFTGSLEVTLTCDTENASIFWFYGTEEDQGVHNYYNGPIYVTETTTLTAYSTKGSEMSEYVTVTFTNAESSDAIETLSQANALEDNTEFTFEGYAVVTAQVGDYLFLRDESGYGQIRGTLDGEFENGDVLIPGWSATKTNNNGWIWYTNPVDVVASGETNAELGAAQKLTGAVDESMVNAYVYIENVKLGIFPPRNFTLPDGSTLPRTEVLCGIDWSMGGNYDVYGIICNVNGTLMLNAIDSKEYVEPTFLRGDVDDNGVVDISDVSALIDFLLSGDESTVNVDAADCNLSGGVDIADLSALIDFLLTGSWD